MKTLRLTKPESAAYAAGERRFWRAMRKQPDTSETCGCLTVCLRDIPETDLWYLAYEANRGDYFIEYRPVPQYSSERWRCPYGTPGDYIKLTRRGYESKERKVTAITVTQRAGKWGWEIQL